MRGYTWIVFKKELMDTFRDRKTIATSILIPILIFPILTFVMGVAMQGLFDDVESHVPIAMIGEESGVAEFLQETGLVEIKAEPDPMAALKELDVFVVVEIPPGFSQTLQEKNMADLILHYDESSQKSTMALGTMQGLITQFQQEVVRQRLIDLGMDPGIVTAVKTESRALAEGESGNPVGAMLYMMLLPLMLTMWSAVGGIPAATDLGAGEKERQTLEPLLATRASRSQILFGKYFAVVIASVMGMLASLLGFVLATVLNPSVLASGGIMPLKSALVIAVACLGLNFTFSAFELAISFYARNFKEAQTYLSPVTILVMIPAYFTLYLDGKLVPESYFHIPIINTIAIIKEALARIYDPRHLLIVGIWLCVYVGAALLFTRRMFNRESVIFRN
jgi:sodium transport system permease protein